MIRKGRKPIPRNEEEMLQQIEERAASKLRESEHRNAYKRAKRIANNKLNMGPALGDAKEPSQKKAKIQKNQLKSKDQQTSQLKPKSNLNSDTLGQEDSPDKFLGDNEQASDDHSSASNNIKPLLESKESAIQQLREKLKEELIASKLEAQGDYLIFEKKEKKKRKSEENDLDLLWTDKEALAFKAFELHHGCKTFSCENCGNKGSQIVNCIDCNQVICGKCDEDIHLQNPFHQRSLFCRTRPGKQLLPTEFLDHKEQIVVKRVVLPLCSPKCDNCETSMSQNARSVMHAVITPKGRFNLHKTSFHCENCSITREAEFSDFIVSGYFPGSPISTKYLFSFELLRMWRHFKYLTPETSENKFLEIILAISADLGRRGTINKRLFNKASKLYEYFSHLLDENVRGKRKTICRACTDKFGIPCPLGLHCDGCPKCIRRYMEKKEKDKAWFGDKLIVSREYATKVRDEISSVKPPGKNTISSKCGNSQYLAVKEVSTKYRKLEGTGIVMAACGHDVVHAAVEMREGKKFLDTFTAHTKCRDLNPQFMINDVVCQYWDFAKSIGLLLPQYKYLTENMRPFLSRVHGQAHGWHCQVLNFGHWKEGACMLLGEETERAFSIFGPYQNSTKCMSEGNWIDFFTCAGFYINERKEWNIPRIITIRMFKAVAGLEFYTDRLKFLLDANQLTEEDLPSIQDELVAEALEYKSLSKGKAVTDISTLQDELEWLHLEWLNVKDRVSAVAEGCKWRTKLSRKQGTLYASAGKKISEINEQIQKTVRKSAAESCNQEKAQKKVVEQTICLVTLKHFEEGIFPWEPANRRSCKEKFKLVDNWHMRNRNREQIELSFREMSQFISSIGSSINLLSGEINQLKSRLSSDEIVRAHVFLKALEIRRLEDLRQVALSYAAFYREDVVTQDVFKFLDDEEGDDETQDDDEMQEG